MSATVVDQNEQYVGVYAVGLAAPGLAGWQESQSVLQQTQPHELTELAKFKPTLLPANEARRATPLVRLAFQAGEDALLDWLSRQPDYDPASSKPADALPMASQLANVFASSGGDSVVMDKLCRTIATKPSAISPTHFHNSVHNAPGGYWGIATGAQAPSSSIGGHQRTFAKAWLEAVLLSQAEQLPVLLVCYDAAIVSPLFAKKPIQHPFASALLLAAPNVQAANLQQLGQPIANVHYRVQSSATTDAPDLSDSLLTLWQDNPAAQALTLLQQLARVTPLNQSQQAGAESEFEGEAQQPLLNWSLSDASVLQCEVKPACS